jgi:hypothetical protein
MCTTERAFLVKHEALEAGAKHEVSDSGTKYASRTTFHARTAELRP